MAVTSENVPYAMAAVTQLDNEQAELQCAAVDPLKQGGGTAKKLILNWVDYVRHLWNTRYQELSMRDHMVAAVGFYRKAGFVETAHSGEGTYLALDPMRFRKNIDPAAPTG